MRLLRSRAQALAHRAGDVSTPTAHRAQHVEGIEAPAVDARAFRQGWRITSRLDALHRDGKLTAGEWQAAVEYRAAWCRVLSASPRSFAPMRVSGFAGGGADRLATLTDTITRLRAVEAHIGATAAILAYWCIVADQSWAATGRKLQRNPETVRDWTTDAIRLLARAWSGARRRPRAKPAACAGQRPGAV